MDVVLFMGFELYQQSLMDGNIMLLEIRDFSFNNELQFS